MHSKQRPRMKGGFVLSDDSETDDSNTSADEKPESQPSKPAASIQVKSRSVAPSTISSARSITPIKQINKSRLHALLGKKQNTTQQMSPKHTLPRRENSNTLSSSRTSPQDYVKSDSQPRRPQALDVRSIAGSSAQYTAKRDSYLPPQNSLHKPSEITRAFDTMQDEPRCALTSRKTDAVDVKSFLAPGGSNVNVTPRNLVRSTIQSAMSEVSNTPVRGQEATKNDVTGEFKKETYSSRSANAHGSQQARQLLPSGKQPSSTRRPTATHRSPILVHTNVRETSINNLRKPGQQNISSPHTTAYSFNGFAQQPTQKRKADNVTDNLEVAIKPSKKRTITSGEVHCGLSDNFLNSKASDIPSGGYRLSESSSAIVRPKKLSSNSAVNSCSTRPNETSIQPKSSGPTKTVAYQLIEDFPAVESHDIQDLRTSYAPTIRRLKHPNEQRVIPEVLSAQSSSSILKKNTLQIHRGALSAPTAAAPALTGLQHTESSQESLPMNPMSGTLEASADGEKPVLGTPKHISEQAEPYFEYSVFERRWSDEQDEYDAKEVGIILRPFADINEANLQVETLFQRLREATTWDLRHTLADWTSTRDEQGCLVCKASFAPFDDPYKEHFVKIWVQRDYVSKFANRTPQDLGHTCFVASTVFVLRLVKLIAPAAESSDSESIDDKTQALLRVYQPLLRSEVFTTLHDANRAARDQQLELSHERKPKNILTVKWQEGDLKHLNEKLRALNAAGDDKSSCWESEFNAFGIGGDRFELIVEKAGICGPRNL